MTEKELYIKIKQKLEQQGTKFTKYYGDSLIYKSGPKPSEFFKRENMGDYSVDMFRIPKRFFIETINESAVEEFLK